METLVVPSIHCSSCEAYVRSVLSSLPIRSLSVDLIRHTLSYMLPNGADPATGESVLHSVRRLLSDGGYDVESPKPLKQPFFQRVKHVFLDSERRHHQRHLRHCSACQAEAAGDPSIADKKEGPSTLEVRIHDPSKAKLQETRLSIEGMTCSSCSGAITRSVLSQPGVSTVDVNLVLNSAVVVHDPDVLSIESLISEIEDLGYGATLVDFHLLSKQVLRRTTFGLVGMTCSACSGSIEAGVKALPSVTSVSVSLLGNSMEVKYDPSVTSLETIIETVSDLGYEALQWETSDAEVSTVKATNERVIQITIDGMLEYVHVIFEKVNARLESLGVISFTPVTITNPRSTIKYTPSESLSIRTILDFPPPLKATLYSPPSIITRSRDVQERETWRVTKLFFISFLIAIPTLVIGVVGMSVLPKHNAFRQWSETPIWGGAMRSVIALWILATLVQSVVGRHFYERAWKGAFGASKGHWHWSRLIHFGNMDLLVALSTSAAYLASVGMMAQDVHRGAAAVMEFGGSGTYFDSCVFLMFFILMGRVLEGRAKVKTGDAIALLGSMKPETALLVSSEQQPEKFRLGSDGFPEGYSSTLIPVDYIEIGDYLLIQPGAVPPADGTIISGSTTFDESSLTGEFLPVSKTVDDAVMTGTTNLTTPIVIRVINIGDETMLQKIVRAVAEGQSRKAPIERLADSITAVFIPAVVWLSLIVLIIWLSVTLSHAIPDSFLPSNRTSNGDRVFFAFEFAISCLVIACPCGIGLAAPTAQAVGSGMAAKAGILAQGGGEAFQMAAGVDTVVFDKTGTLTLGEAVVAGVQAAKGIDDWVFHATRLMEEGSSHPLAMAIAKYCADTYGTTSAAVRLLQSEEVSGKGVKATVALADGTQHWVFVGNESFILSDNHGSVAADMLSPQVRMWRESGYSVVLVAVSSIQKDGSVGDCIVQTFLAISDSIRPEAGSTVASLQASGKEVFMLTGDNEITARAVASKLGIDSEHVVAGVLPQGKADFISKLRDRRLMKRNWYALHATERQSVVAFCGDGLNDTAALAAADVGVALAHGSQVTISAASFVLLSKNSIPSSLITLLNVSRKVYARQKMNFGWALVYNVALIPVAAGAFYAHNHARLPPVWSALAMALSSVSVVLSSLALQIGL
ncbi:hypothetical protein BS47DRAFT_1457376 [Hydnum rufescens UP504]|uniref:HMA domain-containing protein n=1 Tax=Hydnum rufescens UP504 TaxID=1448309 RepID=A0A9P6DTT1_9AGAM|nr:hypothetical protein BS47DRAFT_1457376 [Hydnum rufescens UP504]